MRTAKSPPPCLKSAQEAKITKYKARCEAVQWNFLPAVCHPFGGWYGAGKTFLRKLEMRVIKEESTMEARDDSPPTLEGELSYLMARITGSQLAIILDAGFHEDQAPKR